MGSRPRISGVRELLNGLWKLFGFLGAVLGLRRWWRTLRNDEEDKRTRLIAGVLLLAMLALITLSVVRPVRMHATRTAAMPSPAAAPLTANVNDGEIVADFADKLSLEQIAALGSKLGVTFQPNSPMAVDERLMVADLSGLPRARRAEVLSALRRDTADVEAADFNGTMTLQGERIAADTSLATADAAVASDPRAGMVPNDPRYPEQWNFGLIGMPTAWEQSTGKGAVVAVIDTGCAFEAEKDIPVASDLKGTKFTKPYDFLSKRKKAFDDHGHGTHVAGTIAQATNNGHGVAGIAYDATIMPLKVLSAMGSGRVSDIADAVEYAANNGANVINMSLGGPSPSSVLAKACRYANQRGVTIVCAAGNSGRRGVGYPAAYPECIAVASCGPDGESSFYTSYGPEVAIAAPGGNYRGEDERQKGILQNTVFQKKDVFEFWQGTSMASPHVAGVVALIVEKGIKTPAAVRNRLKQTASPVEGGDPEKYGAGIVNAARAVDAAGGEMKVAGTQIPRHTLHVRAPLSMSLMLLALLGMVLSTRRRLLFSLGYWAAGMASIVWLTCVATGFAGKLVSGVAGSAIWPFAVLAALFGVTRLRPALAGLCAGYAAGAATIGLLGLGPVSWLMANAFVAAFLAWLTCRPSADN